MKIIISNKARKHMEAHDKEFLVDWEILIKRCEENRKIKDLKGQFEVIELDFEYPTGYCNLIKVEENDEIIYAKRLGRDIYSKFVKNIEPKTTNKLTLILKRSYKKLDEYYLITMFAGEKNYKEPEDLNITNRLELQESLNFWSGHALKYDKDIIIEDSIKKCCPYKNLYLAIA